MPSDSEDPDDSSLNAEGKTKVWNMYLHFMIENIFKSLKLFINCLVITSLKFVCSEGLSSTCQRACPERRTSRGIKKTILIKLLN